MMTLPNDRMVDRSEGFEEIDLSYETADHRPADGQTEPRDGLDRPAFSFDGYFTGPVRGYGVFQDRFSALRQEFTVDMEGAWQGDVFVLNEDFRFADGKASNRVWRVRKLPDGLYSATAGDIVGTAQGTPSQHGIRWRYVLKVPVGGREIAMRFDDRMFLQEDGVLINVSDARKFGLRLGRLAASFVRR
jgi:hypothetical protein